MGLALSKNKLEEVLGSSHFCENLLVHSAPRGSDTQAKISFSGVEYDSRQIRGGELFVALAGEASHGHSFLSQAFDRGASVALVEDAALLDHADEPERIVCVQDTLMAFWKLASWWRDELAIPVLGVTGSVGKTTVKEMCASILLQHSLGNFSLKSHNNHVGVPYTICRTSKSHKWLVLEMGMNHPGEISDIAKIARPDVAAILIIAPSHVEFFNSLAEIADAKFEMLDGLSPESTLVLNAQDEEIRQALERHSSRLPRRVLFFGDTTADSSSSLDARLVHYSSRGFEGIEFELQLFEEKGKFSSRAIGRHSAVNACAAALASKALMKDLSLEQISKGMLAFRAPENRANIRRMRNGAVIIDDCYNAGPTSMRASIDLLFSGQDGGQKRGVILGDMLELGERSMSFHLDIAQHLVSQNPAFVIAVGKFAHVFVAEASKHGIPAFEAESALVAAHIASKLEWDSILVKGSRGVQLDKTVNQLLENLGGELIQPPKDTLARMEGDH